MQAAEELRHLLAPCIKIGVPEAKVCLFIDCRKSREAQHLTDALPKFGTLEQFAPLLESICKRPGMYTSAGTWDAVNAFLDGFSAGSQLDPLDGFRLWLIARFEACPSRTWIGIIQDLYPNDAQRLSQLPVLFSEYVGNQDSTAGTPP